MATAQRQRTGGARLRVAAGIAVLAVGVGACAPKAPPPTPSPAPAPSSPGAPPVAGKPAKNYIYGQITEENGLIWTVRGIRGNTYTVRITELTLFGPLFRPGTRDQFKVGARVRVAGVFAGTTITATAVDFSKRSAPAKPAK
ncbi:MAG TPA: hypothetical protein VGH89_10965 [Pseudonocardia sp.]|jgi:hypothetical protein